MINRLHLLILACLLCIGHTAHAQLTSTNLPIVIINTSGTPIGDTQILASFKIIDNSSGTNTPNDPWAYSGNIGVNLRGSSSNPKKSYNVETWTSFKTEIDTPLLGMPSDNDWVLLASYTDRSMQRDLLGFHLFEGMGNYAPRLKICELMIDGNYQGIYLFGEKIKRGTKRVDIAKLKNIDNSGNELTGGYIFKLDISNDDYWTSNYHPPFASGTQDIRFHYDYPQDNDITNVQKAYIKRYVDSFETALQGSDYQDTTVGWRGYAGHKSFKEYFILNELLKSADAFRLATYLYKDKGKKLRIGPPWDLELSLFNTTDCNAAKDTGWAFQYNSFCGSNDRLVPFWWSRLYTDTLFNREMRCRYSELRSTLLDTVQIFHFIDSVATYVNAQNAVGRNFTKWPIWGVSLVNEPTPLSANYAEEISKMKGFISRRLQWLDAQWLPVVCLSTDVQSTGMLTGDIMVYPNPVTDVLYVRLALKSRADVTVKVYDVLGRIITAKSSKLSAGYNNLDLNTSMLAGGTYIVQVFADGKPVAVKRIIK